MAGWCVAIACVCALAIVSGTSVRGEQGRPPSVQSFDHPGPEGLSPRNARYEIDVRLDHGQRRLDGRQTIRWRNISAYETDEVRLQLYWNAWRDLDSTWFRGHRRAGGTLPSRPEHVGAIDLSAIRLRTPDGPPLNLTPSARYIAPDDGNDADRTVLAVPLPFVVRPHDTVELDIEWAARIPAPFTRIRVGWIGDYYFIAHWFPRMGVLEDGGWKAHQFHSHTEFYADYAEFDVRITLPRPFVVAASGRETGRTDNADGTVTHRYRGEDIADFAWTASPRFIDLRRPFEHPALPRVEMRLMLQPEHRGQADRHFSAAAATLQHFGEWFGPYPYGHLTIVDPAYQSGSQGMEYPTLLTAGSRWLAPRRVSVPESVTIHEVGHQFWHGIVGTNEVEHAWMDEGLTAYAGARLIDEIALPNRLALRYFGGFVPWVLHDIRLQRATDGNGLARYREAPSADTPATPTWQYWPTTATAITYSKTALWLHTLERHVGWPVMQQILATYFDRWKFRHPQPDDFFDIANEVSGQDLTWFFDQVHRGSGVFDYGVQELATERMANGNHRTTVVVQRVGDAVFPVDVVTTFADGAEVRERWDGVDRRVVYEYERPTPASTVRIDPERVLLLDVNYTNNSQTLQPRAREASLKWSLTWMMWLQELMLTYGFFL